MGYDSRIYIVNKANTGMNGGRYGEIIATYEMCVFPPISTFFRNSKPAADCYIYVAGQDGETTTDPYGEPITEASVSEVITLLENLKDEDSGYRRVQPLLMALRGFEETADQWEDLTVIHYGH